MFNYTTGTVTVESVRRVISVNTRNVLHLLRDETGPHSAPVDHVKPGDPLADRIRSRIGKRHTPHQPLETQAPRAMRHALHHRDIRVSHLLRIKLVIAKHAVTIGVVRFLVSIILSILSIILSILSMILRIILSIILVSILSISSQIDVSRNVLFRFAVS